MTDVVTISIFTAGHMQAELSTHPGPSWKGVHEDSRNPGALVGDTETISQPPHDIIESSEALKLLGRQKLPLAQCTAG